MTMSTDVEISRRPDIFDANANGQAMVEVASTRAAQEVQAAMIIAKKFPRDQERSLQNILQACKRKLLAEQSVYAYPKGGTTVEGPSIRLAEVLAQCWGNVDFGVIELEQRKGESTVMSYAWDLETNTRQTKIFTVRHERHTKQGKKGLDDPRDIYEMTANQGARRLRACILGIIPGDVVDVALQECNRTMAGNNKEPLIDRVRTMASAFADFGVTVQMIEKRLGHRIDATSDAELLGLRKIYRSLKDNMAGREDFFPVSDKIDDLNAALKPHPTAPEQVIDTTTANVSNEAAEAVRNAPRAEHPEPDTSGTEAEAPAPETPELNFASPREFVEAAQKIADKDGIRKTTFDAAMTTLRLSEGIDGGRRKDSDARKRLYGAMDAGAFDWNTAKIV